MAGWTYRCYGSKDPNDWQRWFDTLTKRDQAKHDSVFDILEQRPQAEWRSPYAKKLKGGSPDLWEILVQTNIAYRVFGYFSGSQEFTVTGLGHHKGNTYKPANIMETSRDRRKAIEIGSLETTPCARPQTP